MTQQLFGIDRDRAALDAQVAAFKAKGKPAGSAPGELFGLARVRAAIAKQFKKPVAALKALPRISAVKAQAVVPGKRQTPEWIIEPELMALLKQGEEHAKAARLKEGRN